MNYTATITNFNFLPMVEDVPSIIHVWILLPTGLTIMLQDRGSIEELSRKYEFKIEGEHSWDFTGFVGRKCNVLKNNSGYHFTSLI